MSSDDALIESVQSSFLRLSQAAKDLNAVSDELGKCVADLDAALKKLNLGITGWVSISSHEDSQDYTYWSQDIGYGKVGGKWGIALRTVSGDNTNPEREEVETWLFNDAPRSLRLSAIGKIPELLEKLSKEATDSTVKISAKLHEARAVAAAIKESNAGGELARPIVSNVPTRNFAGGQKK